MQITETPKKQIIDIIVTGTDSVKEATFINLAKCISGNNEVFSIGQISLEQFISTLPVKIVRGDSELENAENIVIIAENRLF